MSPDFPTDPRQALETSLTALLLGELPPDQAQFLKEALVRDPELARINHKLKQTIELVRQAEAPAAPAPSRAGNFETNPQPAAEEDLRLSPERRERLMEHFKTIPFSRPEAFAAQKSRNHSLWITAVAAVFLGLLGLTLLLPALSKAKSKASWRMEALSAAPAAADDDSAMKSGAALAAENPQVLNFDADTLTTAGHGEQARVAIVLPHGGEKASEEARQLVTTPEKSGATAGKPLAMGIEDNGILLQREEPVVAKDLPPIAMSVPAPAASPVPNTLNDQLSVPDSRSPVTAAGGVGGGMGGRALLPSTSPPTQDKAAIGEADTAFTFSRRYGLARNEPNRSGASVKKEEEFLGRNDGTVTADLYAGYAQDALAIDPNTGLPAPPPGPTDSKAWAGAATPRGFYADKDQSSAKTPVLGDTPTLGTKFQADSRDSKLYFGAAQNGRNLSGSSGDVAVRTPLALGGLEPAIKEEQSKRGDALAGSFRYRKQNVEPAKSDEVIDFQAAQEPQALFKEKLAQVTRGLAGEDRAQAGVNRKGSEAGTSSLLASDSEQPRPSSTSVPSNIYQTNVAGYVNVTNGATIDGNKAVEQKRVPEAGAPQRERLAELRPAQQAAADVPRAKSATPPPVPQPEVQTAENAFSTFSLNVSDVSFKLAAASLENGVLPDPAAIRSEEFLNAFDYRDPEAAPGVPIAFASERARYPFAQNRDLLRFSIKTAAQGRQSGRPLNVVLLLDNSGSMERADRVQILREALRVLASQLQAQDKLSVITFSRVPHLWVDGVSGTEAARVAQEMSGLTPEGGTNLEEAMKLAYKTAARHYLPNGINRVVVLTDGAANLGDVNPEALKKSVEEHRQQGIALDCFGIGWEGYNDDLLEVLSRNGDGRYGFLNTPAEASTEFAAKLAGALHVAASDVKVQVEFNPARVTAYRQIGYARHQLTKEQFRDNKVDAAELAAAEAGNALYVVEVNPEGEGPLATVRARYKVPGTSDYHEHEWTVPYTGTASALEQSSAPMRLAASASAFAEWLATSPYAAGVTPDALAGLMRGVPEVYGADSRPQKLVSMIQQARSLAGK